MFYECITKQHSDLIEMTKTEGSVIIIRTSKKFWVTYESAAPTMWLRSFNPPSSVHFFPRNLVSCRMYSRMCEIINAVRKSFKKLKKITDSNEKTMLKKKGFRSWEMWSCNDDFAQFLWSLTILEIREISQSFKPQICDLLMILDYDLFDLKIMWSCWSQLVLKIVLDRILHKNGPLYLFPMRLVSIMNESQSSLTDPSKYLTFNTNHD